MDRTTRVALMQQLIADAERLSAAFGLRYRVIEPERPHVRSRYGACYADGTIRIRLRHAVTGRPLKYSSLVNTLCHELAHLTHFNHGPRFKALYLRILDRARAEGIYRPGRPELEARVDVPAGGPRKAAQLELFEWVERRRR
jgi:predicted metal-dependent hydrolase